MEKDPNGKNPHEPGAKLDAGKAPIYRGVISYFPRAVQAVANVSQYGANKYAWKGWEAVPDGVNRYSDALGRHIVYEEIDGPYDNDTGLLHKAHAAWNALAALELYLREKEKEQDGRKQSYAGIAKVVGANPQRVSEFGTKDATPNGGFDLRSAQPSGGSGRAVGRNSESPPEGYIG